MAYSEENGRVQVPKLHSERHNTGTPGAGQASKVTYILSEDSGSLVYIDIMCSKI